MHESKHSAAHPIDCMFRRICSLRAHRSARYASGMFVIEGVRQFVQAFEAGYYFDCVIHSPILLRNGLAQRLVRRLASQGVRRIAVTPEQFRALSTTERASGIAGIVQQRWTPLNEARPHHGLGWLVVEQIRSAGNLGTILRTAEAVGMSGVIFVGEQASDAYDPGVVRASMGGIFHLPLVQTRPRELAVWLARHEIATIGLSPSASIPWTALPSAAGHAILLGEERSGLSPVLRR